jgi:hypothetical protein
MAAVNVRCLDGVDVDAPDVKNLVAEAAGTVLGTSGKPTFLAGGAE